MWIAPSSVGDTHELPRTRMVLSKQRTQFKNRIHATLEKYGSRSTASATPLASGADRSSKSFCSKLPPHTRQSPLRLMLDELDHVQANLKTIEGQMRQAFAPCAETTYLQSEPGVGDILGSGD